MIIANTAYFLWFIDILFFFQSSSNKFSNISLGPLHVNIATRPITGNTCFRGIIKHIREDALTFSKSEPMIIFEVARVVNNMMMKIIKQCLKTTDLMKMKALRKFRKIHRKTPYARRHPARSRKVAQKDTLMKNKSRIYLNSKSKQATLKMKNKMLKWRW